MAVWILLNGRSSKPNWAWIAWMCYWHASFPHITHSLTHSYRRVCHTNKQTNNQANTHQHTSIGRIVYRVESSTCIDGWHVQLFKVCLVNQTKWKLHLILLGIYILGTPHPATATATAATLQISISRKSWPKRKLNTQTHTYAQSERERVTHKSAQTQTQQTHVDTLFHFHHFLR